LTATARLKVSPGLLGPILFVALALASFVVAAYVVRSRTPDLELEVIHLDTSLSPNGDGNDDVAGIRFYVRDSDPRATVEIVGPFLEPVRTLYRGSLVAGQRVRFDWNGRTDAGALADPRDRYRLRVLLPGEDRDMVYPRRIELRNVGRG
jgi:hypothetical protein